MVKKAQTKQEKTEETVPEQEQKTKSGGVRAFGRIAFRLAIFILLVGGGYWFFQNPQVWQKESKEVKSDEVLIAQITQLQNQVAALQSQLLNLHEPDISVFENKVESLEKQTLNVIESKADTGTVLGLLTRIDKIENRLDKLAKISDDGALILSAAMLVKQAASEGGAFIYEAEILNQLTPEEASVKKDVSVINEYARNGVTSKLELINKFEEIYQKNQQQMPEEEAGDWKGRLNQKIGEFVKIRKKGEKAPVAKEQKEWSELRSFVEEGKIYKAVKLIESSENDDIKQNQSLQEWLADAQNYVSFYKAVRNIAAYSLAEMKVKYLKNKE